MAAVWVHTVSDEVLGQLLDMVNLGSLEACSPVSDSLGDTGEARMGVTYSVCRARLPREQGVA
jgi:hypothetical protein